jgi:hypothetical protein
VPPQLSLDELSTRVPKLHLGRTITWGIDSSLAELLDATLEPGDVTLETGSGYSTLVILRGGVARHLAITPNVDEFLAIREFCAEYGIPTASLETIPECSQDWLPRAARPELNLVLVDGDHAFPIPFIDWYYTADRLVVGGLMIVDDVQLVTGRLLADFMDADPCWERARQENERFAVFRKLRHPVHGRGWWLQPYVSDTNPVRHVSVVRAMPLAPPGPAYRALVKIYRHLPPGAQALFRRFRRLIRKQ